MLAAQRAGEERPLGAAPEQPAIPEGGYAPHQQQGRGGGAAERNAAIVQMHGRFRGGPGSIPLSLLALRRRDRALAQRRAGALDRPALGAIPEGGTLDGPAPQTPGWGSRSTRRANWRHKSKLALARRPALLLSRW